MILCHVLVIFVNNIGLYLFGQSDHDVSVNLGVVLVLSVLGVYVSIGVSGDFFHGKLAISGDEIHHIDIDIRDSNDFCVNLFPS